MDSNKFTPRLLGFMFVFVAVASALGGLMLSSLSLPLVGPPDNIFETMISISDNPTAMQMSIVCFLIEAISIVLLTVLLYTTLKKQNKIIARWAFGLWIIEAVFLAVREINAFSLLYTSQEYVKAVAPDSSYFQTLGSLFYELMQFSYDVQMVFYCSGGILFYYLFLRSKYVPKVLPIWGIIAASLGFIGELFALFGYVVPLYVFLPILPFELTIGIWLMVKGFNPAAIASGSAKTDIKEFKMIKSK
ncbi:MAG: DUF4386 domain-containing protein [Methanocellales archaeon]|nr:DUF4386 domain-containing protein [Methanocellales archaeon]